MDDMGLDTTHNCWHGAYSSFSRWRNALAVAAGYELMTEDGLEFAVVANDCTWNTVEGLWDGTPSDPLLVLLQHSDCDGKIYPEQAGPLADRIEELMPLLPDEGGGHIGNYRSRTQQFIDGLRQAAAANEPVVFH